MRDDPQPPTDAHRWTRDRWSRDGDALSLLRSRPAPCPVRFDAAPEPVIADLSRAAFVIIDMQNDFLSPEGWFATARGADPAPLAAPIAAINALAPAFRALGAPVIHVNWGVRADGADLPANVLDKGSDCGARPGYTDRIASGRVLVDGAWGAASDPRIGTDPRDIHVSKTRLSGFRNSPLDQVLRRLGVDTLFYAGVNLDRCVFATLMDGCFEGYDAVLVEDACATVSPPGVAASIHYLVRLLYGSTAHSDALLPALQAAAPASSPAP
ncbi:isochorismatase family cysteine hydrolase [Rhodovulum sp. DZ06]|uniref:isochorismatase family cysteine hydrolase n=1 Tax=Rhodovulum sp. DZ06 TaxID=3425126 RepID=UPI003D349E90